MRVLKTETLALRDQNEIVLARQAARRWAAELGLSLVDQTKIVTATSELARNAVEYGGGGTMTLELLETETRRGLRIIFEDHGPGIADVSLALSDGYTTGNGMGLGLGGSRRLVNEFDIQSRVGEGTRISIVRWK
ncbi:MAG TPA: anti-sigma regulatory factor [Gemmatimonadaceae bacterium]|nr:anti-sigma regulatory factor [Gemmatimonadaceae bacterium]